MKMTKLPESYIQEAWGIQTRWIYFQGVIMKQFFNWDLYRSVLEAKAHLPT